MSGPAVFGVPHLSEDAVAAFADGVLSTSATERARRHCAECAECAAAVRGQREAVMLLRAAPAPTLPSGLLAKLAGLPMSAVLTPSAIGVPAGLDADGVPVLVNRQLSSRRTGRQRQLPSPAQQPKPAHKAGPAQQAPNGPGPDEAGSGLPGWPTH